jgi:hypothetical protein
MKDIYLMFKYFNNTTNRHMNNYKLMGVSLAVLLILTITTAGFTNSAFADGKKVKVSCIDLALDLISWDGMYAYIADDDLADLEDAFGDDNEVDPASFEDIIDDHMEDLLDDFKDAKCKKHIDKDLKKWIKNNVNFER